MVPPAPGRFSMTMGCPSWGESLSVTVRAMMSVPLPGVNGTMILIDFAGHACACAPTCRAQSASVAIDLPSFPDTLASSTWNPSGLRFLRRFRLARTVEGDRLANERLEGSLVNFFSFVDVDRAACVSVETGVEETGRILQRRALGEGELHDILVGLASADDAVVRPDRSAHPLPLLDDVRVCFLDELAHSAEGFPAPSPEFGDSFRDELRCRLALARARLFHVLILEVPDIFHLQESGGHACKITYRIRAIPHQKSMSRWEELRRQHRYLRNPEQAEFSIAVCHPPSFPLRLHPSP